MDERVKEYTENVEVEKKNRGGDGVSQQHSKVPDILPWHLVAQRVALTTHNCLVSPCKQPILPFPSHQHSILTNRHFHTIQHYSINTASLSSSLSVAPSNHSLKRPQASDSGQYRFPKSIINKEGSGIHYTLSSCLLLGLDCNSQLFL